MNNIINCSKVSKLFLLLPLVYLVILIVIILMKAYYFTDYSGIIVYYVVGLFLTYVLSIPYMLSKKINKDIMRIKYLKLLIFHLPSLLMFFLTYI